MEKGGLNEALAAQEVTAGTTVHLLDELRLGLHGRTRRVLAPRGVKVVQRVQIEYCWRYLLLAVDPLQGTICWAWLGGMKQAYLRPVLKDWRLGCVVWDGAPSHRGKQIAALAMTRIALPPYSPELNPAERIFEEIRARTEGVVYESLEAKRAVAEAYLQELGRDPERVTRLCGWSWIRDALADLPPQAA